MHKMDDELFLSDQKIQNKYVHIKCNETFCTIAFSSGFSEVNGITTQLKTN